jgi:hypothetical protein
LLGPKPRIVVIEARKPDGKGKAESAGPNATAIATGRQMPLPGPKPKISEIEARKQEAKSKVDSVGAVATDGKQEPSLMPKSKPPEIETKGQNGKGKAEAMPRGLSTASFGVRSILSPRKEPQLLLQQSRRRQQPRSSLR